MNISEITGGISSGAAQVGETIKSAALWTGRQIVTGFGKLDNLIKSAWNSAIPFIKTAATRTLEFSRTAPGMCLVAITAGTVLIYTASQLQDDESLALALRVTGAICFIGAGAAMTLGALNGFTTPLI